MFQFSREKNKQAKPSNPTHCDRSMGTWGNCQFGQKRSRVKENLQHNAQPRGANIFINFQLPQHHFQFGLARVSCCDKPGEDDGTGVGVMNFFFFLRSLTSLFAGQWIGFWTLNLSAPFREGGVSTFFPWGKANRTFTDDQIHVCCWKVHVAKI